MQSRDMASDFATDRTGSYTGAQQKGQALTERWAQESPGRYGAKSDEDATRKDQQRAMIGNNPSKSEFRMRPSRCQTGQQYFDQGCHMFK